MRGLCHEGCDPGQSEVVGCSSEGTVSPEPAGVLMKDHVLAVLEFVLGRCTHVGALTAVSYSMRDFVNPSMMECAGIINRVIRTRRTGWVHVTENKRIVWTIPEVIKDVFVSSGGCGSADDDVDDVCLFIVEACVNNGYETSFTVFHCRKRLLDSF